MKGSMFKKGEKRRNWLMRFFTLENGALCYYEKQDAKSPKGFILTKDITEVRGKTSEKVGSKSGKGDFVFEVVTKARTYYFAPEEQKAKDDWMAAIKSWIGYNEDVSTKEQPKPGDSKRASQTVAPVDPKPADAAAASSADAAPAAGGAGDATTTATIDASANATTAAAGSTTTDASAATSNATPARDAAKTDEGAATESAAVAPTTPPSDERKPASHDDAKPSDATPSTPSTTTTATTTAAGEAGAASDAKAEEEESKIVKYESQYDYDAQEDNELSFKEGDIVTVLDTFKGAGWWKAELNGKIGLIPGNFFVKTEKK